MDDSCSCGALLPANARFCHRCGKPQFTEPVLIDPSEFQHPPGIEHSADDLRALAAAAGPPTPEPPPAITFNNANAVRAGFFTAIIIWILMIIPLGGAAGVLLKLLVLLGGGFLAVVFYSRRTGLIVSVAAGARLGWITGVLFYVIWMLFFTITIVVLQDQGGLMAVYKKQLEEANASAENIRQVTEIMQSPEVLVVVVLLMLAMLFVAFTLPMILGGAAAAKALERD